MRILAEGLQFPEGPVILPDGSLAVVEIARETLTRICAEGRTEVIARIPGGPNGAAVGPDGLVYICNNGGFSWIRKDGTLRTGGIAECYRGGSIDVVNIASGKVERLYDRCDGYALNGPNDLVFDGYGGFWFTDYGKRTDRTQDRGFVYWARADGSEIREVVGPLMTPNGIGLSPDGTVLYVAETETGRLWAWDIVSPGLVAKAEWPAYAGGRLIAALGGASRLDSLAVTASGNVCVAALQNASIASITPSTGEIHEVPVPDELVTNICFGQADLQTAFITMSYHGRVAICPWDEPGLSLPHADYQKKLTF